MPMGSWGMAWQAVARTQADIDLNLGARRPDRRAGWMRGISALALAAPGRAMPALAAPALAALLSLGALNVSAGPARAEQPDPPVTYNAGMGTADAPREAPRPAPLRSGGIDDAGDSEAGHAMHGIAVHVTTPAAAPSPAPATAAIAPEAAVAAPAEAAPQAPAQAITPAQANAPAPESPQLPVAATPSSPVPAAADARAGETPVSAPAAAEAAPVPQSPVAQALAGILAQPVAGGTKKEQEGLVAFYTERQDAPLFVDEHGITARGMAVLAVCGNIVTAWSWFGTNMLGVGLHSYGFMASAAFWLVAFVVLQLAIIFIGLMPKRLWMSFRRPRAQRETAAPTAIANQPA